MASMAGQGLQTAPHLELDVCHVLVLLALGREGDPVPAVPAVPAFGRVCTQVVRECGLGKDYWAQDLQGSSSLVSVCTANSNVNRAIL